jgi:hypothetical protein
VRGSLFSRGHNSPGTLLLDTCGGARAVLLNTVSVSPGDPDAWPTNASSAVADHIMVQVRLSLSTGYHVGHWWCNHISGHSHSIVTLRRQWVCRRGHAHTNSHGGPRDGDLVQRFKSHAVSQSVEAGKRDVRCKRFLFASSSCRWLSIRGQRRACEWSGSGVRVVAPTALCGTLRLPALTQRPTRDNCGQCLRCHGI